MLSAAVARTYEGDDDDDDESEGPDVARAPDLTEAMQTAKRVMQSGVDAAYADLAQRPFRTTGGRNSDGLSVFARVVGAVPSAALRPLVAACRATFVLLEVSAFSCNEYDVNEAGSTTRAR